MTEYLIKYDRNVQELTYRQGINVFSRESELSFNSPQDDFGKSLLMGAQLLVSLNKAIDLEIRVEVHNQYI